MANFHSLLSSSGYENTPSLYVGGLKVMLVFKDRNIAMNFMNREYELWGKALVSVNLWEGQYIPFDRLACLKVVGVPLLLRDDTLQVLLDNETVEPPINLHA
ncbi:hypothetical protein L1987_63379 [Smallanthus sonchifolius]|uniref:Uncharacterized protein n=1 Tax=Smallanthus sonchifolius TaxID=185202 RepID=A0ACB9CD69_9ASTR|nr:hypothetical protein L1987_63379 [Smallanthus sonchifolius]